MSQNAKITIDQAIKPATERVPGKVVEAEIEAELERKHDRMVWEIEVASADNKLTEAHIEAMSNGKGNERQKTIIGNQPAGGLWSSGRTDQSVKRCRHCRFAGSREPPALRTSDLSHFTQFVIGIPITCDGLHEVIAEEDDDSIPLVLHHHRGGW